MAIDLDPKKNHFLAALPEAEWQRWLPHLDAVEMPLGQVLYESGRTLEYVYFPITSIVSLLYVMENGASAEIAVVGNEGIVGVSQFMGGKTTPSRAVVQSAGVGFRLQAQMMKNEFNRAGPAMYLLLCYTQALITQMAQTAACNRHHSLAKTYWFQREGYRDESIKDQLNHSERISSAQSPDDRICRGPHLAGQGFDPRAAQGRPCVQAQSERRRPRSPGKDRSRTCRIRHRSSSHSAISGAPKDLEP
jgi:hypothetical protein